MQTDAQLRSDIIDEMSMEPFLDIKRINVEVRNSTVYLNGQVESFAQKSAAERAAYRATGRSAVVTRLSINRCRTASGDESWVSEVRRSLEHDPQKTHRALE
ncbi:MAG: BON domain-containing protein [Caldimonas sp.]